MGTRVELRCPDPTCNPYLEMALCLAAGLDGIKNKIVPAPAVDYNVFDLSNEELEEKVLIVFQAHLKRLLRLQRLTHLLRKQ